MQCRLYLEAIASGLATVWGGGDAHSELVLHIDRIDSRK